VSVWDTVFGSGQGDEAESIRLDEVQPEEIRWLWRRRVPLGTITILDGDPGLGKSTLTLDIAARVSTGSVFPDLELAPRGDVILLSAEDSLSATIRPRLEAAGADLTRITALTAVRRRDGIKSPPDIRTDIAAIEKLLTQETLLVVIDPLMAYLPDDVNANRDHEIRRCMLPLYEFAHRTGVAVILVRHLKKSDHSHGALYAGGGSIGLAGAARSVLMVGRHPEDPVRRVLATVKSNLSSTPLSLGFVIEPTVEGVPTIAWDLEPLSITADELMAVRKPRIAPYNPD
jgi:RecA-family ATPase